MLTTSVASLRGDGQHPRIEWTPSTGIGGHLGPEYALPICDPEAVKKCAGSYRPCRLGSKSTKRTFSDATKSSLNEKSSLQVSGLLDDGSTPNLTMDLKRESLPKKADVENIPATSSAVILFCFSWRLTRQRIAKIQVKHVEIGLTRLIGGDVPWVAKHIGKLSHELQCAVIRVPPKGTGKPRGCFLNSSVMA